MGLLLSSVPQGPRQRTGPGIRQEISGSRSRCLSKWGKSRTRGRLLAAPISRLSFRLRTWSPLTEELRRESLLVPLRRRIRDVRQGPDELLYLLTDENDGAVLRIEPAE